MLGTVATLTAGTLATGAAIAGTALTAAATDPADRPHRDLPCGAVWDRLPQELRDDLAALEEMSPQERRAALEDVRHEALQGGYGDRVQRVAERMADRRAGRTPAERRAVRDLAADRLRERREACS